LRPERGGDIDEPKVGSRTRAKNQNAPTARMGNWETSTGGKKRGDKTYYEKCLLKKMEEENCPCL